MDAGTARHADSLAEIEPGPFSLAPFLCGPFSLEGSTPGAPRSARAYARVAEEIAEYANLTPAQMAKKIKALEKEMYGYAKDLEFEKAAAVRDRIKELQGKGLAV